MTTFLFTAEEIVHYQARALAAMGEDAERLGFKRLERLPKRVPANARAVWTDPSGSAYVVLLQPRAVASDRNVTSTSLALDATFKPLPGQRSTGTPVNHESITSYSFWDAADYVAWLQNAAARQHRVSPMRRFPVGARVLTTRGRGTVVENQPIGLTVELDRPIRGGIGGYSRRSFHESINEGAPTEWIDALRAERGDVYTDVLYPLPSARANPRKKVRAGRSHAACARVVQRLVAQGWTTDDARAALPVIRAVAARARGLALTVTWSTLRAWSTQGGVLHAVDVRRARPVLRGEAA